MKGPNERCIPSGGGAIQMVHTKMEVSWGECQGEGNQDCTPKGGQRKAFLLGPG